MNTQLLLQQENIFPFISKEIFVFHTKEKYFILCQKKLNPNQIGI